MKKKRLFFIEKFSKFLDNFFRMGNLFSLKIRVHNFILFVKKLFVNNCTNSFFNKIFQ